MSKHTLWNQTLYLESHEYFERKKQFKLNEDRYRNWILFAVESGKFYFRIGDEWGEAGPGDLVFCPPDTKFKREMVSPLALHYFEFTFGNNTHTKIPQHMTTFLAHPADNKRLDSDFSYLRMYRFASDPRRMRRKQMILNDFWQLSCDVWENEFQQGGMLKLQRTDDAVMNHAAVWLYENAYKPFNLGTLSHSLNLSAVQFTRRFRQAFGIAPSDYVRTLRMNKIRELLIETDMTLDQIAAHCGYDNGLYLSRVFRNNIGMSPSTYRKAHQQMNHNRDYRSS